MTLSEWQRERLNEGLGGNPDIANASELREKKIRDLLTDVETLPLDLGVNRILDTLDPNSETDPVVQQAARLCLEVMCEEPPTDIYVD